MKGIKGFELENVSRVYGGKTVLRDISCRIEPNASWGILGPSGSGKSTLLRIMAGLEPPDQGKIFLDKRLVSRDGAIEVPASKRQISMVFQDLALWPNLTAEENVRLGLGKDKDAARKAMESLSMCSISHLAKRYPAQLSGGEQQRLALARALAARPAYLLLDEPFSGLDMEIKSNIINKIKVLTAAHKITTILVSHDPFEVSSLCRRIILIDQGEIVESGDFKTLMQNSKFPLLRAFRDCLHSLHMEIKG